MRTCILVHNMFFWYGGVTFGFIRWSSNLLPLPVKLFSTTDRNNATSHAINLSDTRCTINIDVFFGDMQFVQTRTGETITHEAIIARASIIAISICTCCIFMTLVLIILTLVDI